MAYRAMMILGTRAEAIRMAPLARALIRLPQIHLHICTAGPAGDGLPQLLQAFELEVDDELVALIEAPSLNACSQHLLGQLDPIYARLQPDAVLVHGDTTTSLIAALAAFHRRIPVAHVEAGLRTSEPQVPWPEDANRRLAAVLADLHFPPTSKARDNLLREGVPLERIEVAGNTLIDALLWMRGHLRGRSWRPEPTSPLARLGESRRLVLVSGQRRDSLSPGLERTCQALATLAGRYPEVDFVCAKDLVPALREPVQALLAGHANLLLLAPQDYRHFVWLMDHAYLILTDSVDIQEQAPALGKPLLVLRKLAERPAVLEGGTALLVGTDVHRIVDQTALLLEDAELHERMSRPFTPYGDGHASERIAARLCAWLEQRRAEKRCA
ncbi:UDP-N-acetylglucosamine 2-epimerase (non-hydrolyzing) [Pseudomonas solani]|uniref:UDP-N-acetylglucosamine 2-epimerase (non-hydrolyzing) n=1 Tax=Pseudomonas solani TaxID=2731552 RepID=A0AAU7Y6C4_9PSED